QHPTVRQQFAARLVDAGVVTEEQADELYRQVQAKLKQAHERLKESLGAPHVTREGRIPASTVEEVVTAVAPERLRALNAELLRVPDGFEPHPKLFKQLERRLETIDRGGIDWGQAEALAFASLLVDGIP